MQDEHSIPLVAKLSMLCVHFGSNVDGKPAICDLKAFARAFREDVSLDDQFLDGAVSQTIRNRVEYRAGDFTLSGSRKHPAYSIDVIPIVLRCIGIHLENHHWHRHRPGVVALMAVKCGPFAETQSQQMTVVAATRKRQSNFKHFRYKSEVKKARALQEQVEDLKKQLALATDPHGCWSFGMAPWHSKNMFYDKVPVWRGVHLVLRRTAGRVSACKLGLSVGLDVHRTTVTWWELRTHAAFVSRRREFYRTCDDYCGIAAISILDDARSLTFDCFYTHLVRCDATNASVWQKRKLHCLTVESQVQVPGRRHLFTCRGVADLVPVTSSTGQSLVDMIKAQISDVGARTWVDVGDTCFIHSYIFCTDAGGDVAAARRLIAYEVANGLDNVFLFHCDCLMHQYSLAIGNLLKRADDCLIHLLERAGSSPFKYCGTLVTIFNVWREHAAASYFIAKELHPNHLEHFENMPPKCIPSRWGTKDRCEETFLKLPSPAFGEIMRLVLDKRLRAAAKQCMKDEADVSAALAFIISVDEAQLTSRGGYSEKMAKMSQDAVRGIESPHFRGVCEISFRVCGPWREFRKFLQSHQQLVRDTGLGSMAHLVHGKAAELRAAALFLTNMHAWQDLTDEVDADLKDHIVHIIQEMSMASLALFDRRVMARVNLPQAKLLLMAKRPHNQMCEERQASDP